MAGPTPSSSSATDGRADLDEGQPDLSQRILERPFGFAEATRQPLDQRGHGVDGQAGLVELRWTLRQVDGGQLEQAVGVVGHDDLGRGAEQLAPKLVEPPGQLGSFLGPEVIEVHVVGHGLVSGPGVRLRRPARAARVRGCSSAVRSDLVFGRGPDSVLAFGCPEAAHAW